MPVSQQAQATARCISAIEAAAYLGISRRTFERAVENGGLPKGIRLGKRRIVWDRHALDAHLDRLSTPNHVGNEEGRAHTGSIADAIARRKAARIAQKRRRREG
jgi:excisionase family DNA binding protein